MVGGIGLAATSTVPSWPPPSDNSIDVMVMVTTLLMMMVMWWWWWPPSSWWWCWWCWWSTLSTPTFGEALHFRDSPSQLPPTPAPRSPLDTKSTIPNTNILEPKCITQDTMCTIPNLYSYIIKKISRQIPNRTRAQLSSQKMWTLGWPILWDPPDDADDDDDDDNAKSILFNCNSSRLTF